MVTDGPHLILFKLGSNWVLVDWPLPAPPVSFLIMPDTAFVLATEIYLQFLNVSASFTLLSFAGLLSSPCLNQATHGSVSCLACLPTLLRPGSFPPVSHGTGNRPLSRLSACAKVLIFFRLPQETPSFFSTPGNQR